MNKKIILKLSTIFLLAITSGFKVSFAMEDTKSNYKSTVSTEAFNLSGQSKKEENESIVKLIEQSYKSVLIKMKEVATERKNTINKIFKAFKKEDKLEDRLEDRLEDKLEDKLDIAKNSWLINKIWNIKRSIKEEMLKLEQPMMSISCKFNKKFQELQEIKYYDTIFKKRKIDLEKWALTQFDNMCKKQKEFIELKEKEFTNKFGEDGKTLLLDSEEVKLTDDNGCFEFKKVKEYILNCYDYEEKFITDFLSEYNRHFNKDDVVLIRISEFIEETIKSIDDLTEYDENKVDCKNSEILEEKKQELEEKKKIVEILDLITDINKALVIERKYLEKELKEIGELKDMLSV